MRGLKREVSNSTKCNAKVWSNFAHQVANNSLTKGHDHWRHSFSRVNFQRNSLTKRGYSSTTAVVCIVFGSCVLKASVGQHVDQHSTDMSTDTRLICRLTLDRYVDRYSADMWANIGWYLVEILADMRSSYVGWHVNRYVGWQSTDMSNDHRPICQSTLDRYVDRHLTDMLADIGRYSVETSADTRSSVNRHVLKLVDRPSPLSVDTWSVCWSTLSRHLDHYGTMNCRCHIGRLVSVVYRSTFGVFLATTRAFIG